VSPSSAVLLSQISTTTCMHNENSEVLLLESVAVAVMKGPPEKERLVLKFTLFPTVVTSRAPRRVWPSPWFVGSQESLAKNSKRKGGSARLFKVPSRLRIPPLRTARFNTGKLGRPLGPSSPSSRSFGVTPSGIPPALISIPSAPFANIELERIAMEKPSMPTSRKKIPSCVLKAMMFPALGIVPPTKLFVSPKEECSIPEPELGRGRVPVRSVPIKLPWRVWFVPLRLMPSESLPEIRFPAPGAVPPIRQFCEEEPQMIPCNPFPKSWVP